jgi:hypothetical protein
VYIINTIVREEKRREGEEKEKQERGERREERARREERRGEEWRFQSRAYGPDP